jgi:hypothetical protein
MFNYNIYTRARQKGQRETEFTAELHDNKIVFENSTVYQSQSNLWTTTTTQ